MPALLRYKVCLAGANRERKSRFKLQLPVPTLNDRDLAILTIHVPFEIFSGYDLTELPQDPIVWKSLLTIGFHLPPTGNIPTEEFR